MGRNGLSIVKTIRAAEVRTPVLFLTTMGGVDDRVEGLEAGGDDYLAKPFAFSELLARIHALARRPPLAGEQTVLKVAEDNGQTLEADVPATMTCRGDRDLLTQMLANLVENAIRHTPAGTRIVVGLSRTEEGSLLSVADNGQGIPPEDRDRVFRRFYRSEQSRTTPGTGLGLALVKAVIDLHDGSVAILDNGPGLRVEMRFPCGAA